MWKRELNYSLKLFNQIFLFINVYSAIAWFLSFCWFLYQRANAINPEFSIKFAVICFFIACPVEVLRLYLGYSGNLKDNVLDSAGFLIISTFISFPCNLYLLISVFNHLHIISFSIQTFQLALLPIEILLSFILIKKSLHERKLQFQMMNSTKGSNIKLK